MTLTLLALACATRATPTADAPPATPAEVAPASAPAAGGNNANFLADDLDPDAYASRFERPEREVYAHRHAVVQALELAPGSAVADIGAGTGAYLEPLIDAVGADGKVFAVDLSPGFVAHLRQRAAASGWEQVEVIQSTTDHTGLAPASVDVAILVDVYHHLDQVEPFLADLSAALRPGGRMVLVEFHRIEGVSSEWILNHVALSREQVIEQLTGLGWTEPTELQVDGLVDNYVLAVTAPAR